MKQPIPCFDLSLALAHAMNQMPFLKNLANTFVDSLPPTRVALSRAVEDGDAVAIARTAHRIKGAAMYFAAEACMDAAAKLEVAAESNDFDQVGLLLSRLERELDRLAASLQALE